MESVLFVPGELLIDVEDKLNRKKYVSSLDVEIVSEDVRMRIDEFVL